MTAPAAPTAACTASGFQFAGPVTSRWCPMTLRSIAQPGSSTSPPRNWANALQATTAHTRGTRRGAPPTSARASPTVVATPGSWVTVNTRARSTARSCVTWAAVNAASTAPETASSPAPSMSAAQARVRSRRVRETPAAASTSVRPARSSATRPVTRCTTAIETIRTVKTVSRDMNCTTGSPAVIMPT